MENDSVKDEGSKKKPHKTTFVDGLLMLVGVALVAMFMYAAMSSLEPTEHKPSEILTDPGKHSMLDDWGITFDE